MHNLVRFPLIPYFRRQSLHRVIKDQSVSCFEWRLHHLNIGFMQGLKYEKFVQEVVQNIKERRN